jgi:Fip1 motif
MSTTSDAKSNSEDSPDPTTLPPVSAPPSHPSIDPTVTGMLEGRPVFEVDMAALADKAWRRPGSDISDWFNYGFDEISWEAYCYRRRELGDLAAVLKTNVVVRALLLWRLICIWVFTVLLVTDAEFLWHARGPAHPASPRSPYDDYDWYNCHDGQRRCADDAAWHEFHDGI